MLPFTTTSYFGDLLESFASAVVIFNVRDEAYALNEQAAALLGRDRESCLGLGWEEMFCDMTPREELGQFMRLSMNKRACPRPMEIRLERAALQNHPHDSAVHLSVSCSKLMENDKIFGVLISLADVSHIYRLHEREKKMLQANAALEQERAQGLRQLAMAVAHQVRNPLMSIAGFARLIGKREPLSDTGHEYMSAIHEGTERLETIVRAVSDYTGVHAGPRRKIRASDLLHDLAGELERFPQKEPERPRVHVAPPQPRLLPVSLTEPVLFTDPGMALEILLYLAHNGIEAMAGQDGERTLALSLSQSNGLCRLDLADSGPGIPVDTLPYVFDPFFTTKAVGVGMGLCMARQMAAVLDGEVLLANRADGESGALASLLLPLA